MTRLIIILTFSSLLTVPNFAQRIVSGYVFDAFTNKPLSNVLIKVDTFLIYSFTDKNGNFSVFVPKEAKVLHLTAKDYVPETVVIKSEYLEIGLTNRAMIKFFDNTLDQLTKYKVVSASNIEETIASAPSMVLIFTEEDIKRYGWTDLQDVFRTLAQADVSYLVQGELGTLVILRGISSNQRLLVLQDGERLNPASGEPFVYGYNLPLDYYQRIEIVLGPTAIYGADSYSGVINLITKKGKEIDGLAVKVGTVSSGAIYSSLLFGKHIAQTDFVFYLRGFSGDMPYLPKYYADDTLSYAYVNDYAGLLDVGYPVRNWNLFTKLKYSDLCLRLFWQHSYQSNAYTTLAYFYPHIKSFVWAQEIRQLNLSYKSSINSLKYELSLNLDDYKVLPMSNFTTFKDNYDYYFAYKYAYSAQVNPKFQINWQVNQKINLISGLSYSYILSFPKTHNLDNVPYQENLGFIEDLSDFVDSSGYVYGYIELSDSVLGLRNYQTLGWYGLLKGRMSSFIFYNLALRFDYSTLYGFTVNPKLGVSFVFSDKYRLKLIAGSGYLQPSNYYRWENWASVVGMHIPNLNLKPERIASYEMNFWSKLAPFWVLEFSVFRNDMYGIIRPRFVTVEENGGHPFYNPLRQLLGQPPSSGFVETNDNIGRIYSQGIASLMTYYFDNLRFILRYSYLEGYDFQFKTNLPKISNHKLVIETNYNFLNFQVFLATRFYSAVYPMPTNPYFQAPKRMIPGSMIFFANLLFNPSQNLTFNVRIDNIFNTKYYTAAPYLESGWIMPYAPQPPRMFYFEINYKF